MVAEKLGNEVKRDMARIDVPVPRFPHLPTR
jgi:hypothetical protein